MACYKVLRLHSPSSLPLFPPYMLFYTPLPLSPPTPPTPHPQCPFFFFFKEYDVTPRFVIACRAVGISSKTSRVNTRCKTALSLSFKSAVTCTLQKDTNPDITHGNTFHQPPLCNWRCPDTENNCLAGGCSLPVCCPLLPYI